MTEVIMSISLDEREGLPEGVLQVDIVSLRDVGVSITRMLDPAQKLDIQCPRQAAMLGTIGMIMFTSSSTVQVKNLAAAAAKKSGVAI